MLQGYRTYITLLVGIVIKILEKQGIIITPASLETTIDVLILIIAGIFRYYATKKQIVR